MTRSHLNQKQVKNANCLQVFVHNRCSKCPPFARTHAWRHWSINYSVNNVLSEIGPYRN